MGRLSVASGGSGDECQQVDAAAPPGHEIGEALASPLSTYSATGGLRQDPRRARRIADRGHDSANWSRRDPLTTSAFDLPDHLAPKADPALIAGDEQHFAAIAESLEQSIADLSDRLDAARKAPGGTGQEAHGPRPGGPPADRPAARAAPLRAGPVPRAHGRRGRPRARVRRPARPHRQRRAAGCWSTGAPPRPSRSSGRPTPTRWGWPAAAGTAGPGAGSATTGTRCSPRTGSTGTPRRSTTSPRSSPAWAAAGRPGCATCSAPSRPTRTRSSARGPAARSSSTAARAPARPSSRCTAPRTSSTPTRGSVTAAAACCSSARTSPTWRTSPTCSPASARRACRPAPCATWSPRAPRRRSRPTRRWPA